MFYCNCYMIIDINYEQQKKKSLLKHKHCSVVLNFATICKDLVENTSLAIMSVDKFWIPIHYRT